jgi:phytoene desaturase
MTGARGRPGRRARPRPRVAVVGAGFAGLAAAIDLARGGARVQLLERGPEVGGKAGEWRAGGFRFDVGPSVFTLPDVVDAIFLDAGRERPFELRPLAPICRYRYPSGRVWDVYADLDRTLSGLTADEGAAYRRALGAARRLYEDAAPTFVRGPAPGWRQLGAYGVRAGWRAHPGRRLPDLLDALGVRGDLLPFFLRFATYFGGDPYRAPAVLHNIAWVELGLGVTQPMGGVHAVVRALRALAEELGVEVHTGTDVVALPTRGGRVREVVTDRTTIAVDAVVAAVDRRWALALVGRRVPPRRSPSLSGTVALVGVRGTTPELSAHNVLFPDDYAAEFDDLRAGRHPRDPTLYLHASVKGDPGDAPAGHENWFVMANAPALPPEDERGAPGPTGRADEDRARADEDRARADAAAARGLRATLAARGLDPAGRTVVERDVGPADLARFGDRGAIYGSAPNGLLATLRPGPKLPGVGNARLAGGTVHPGGGIPLALLSGRYAAASLLRDLDG